MRVKNQSALAERGVIAAALLLAMAWAGAGCGQSEHLVDEFGTGGASSVTGDGDDDDDDQADDDSTADAPDDSADATVDVAPAQATKTADAGVKQVDAGKPPQVDATVVKPVADAGTPVDAGPVVGPAAAGPSKLTFTVTTAPVGGRYSPKNVYAIWVVDGQGKFVKTLAKFAKSRAIWLTGWNAASGGNVVDAVTGATMPSHSPRTVTWDLTDVSKKTVPDGDYQIVAEVTDADKTGASTKVPFTKGPTPVRLTPADQANFKSMSLVLE